MDATGLGAISGPYMAFKAIYKAGAGFTHPTCFKGRRGSADGLCGVLNAYCEMSLLRCPMCFAARNVPHCNVQGILVY